jgi:hypothetical protein
MTLVRAAERKLHLPSSEVAPAHVPSAPGTPPASLQHCLQGVVIDKDYTTYMRGLHQTVMAQSTIRTS